MGELRDIPEGGPPPRKMSERRLAKFQRRLQEDAARLTWNADVYAQKRASKSWLSPKLSRIIQGASFVPAHPSRYQAGGLVKAPQKFIVHRPGAYGPKKSGLDPSLGLYIIREFSWEHRAASTHFIVYRDGSIVQMVDLQDVAYHCGTSGSPNNWDTVGAELEGYIHENPPVAQKNGLAKLIRMIADNYGWGATIDRTRLLGHSEILSRKNDPGTFPYEDIIARVNSHQRFSKNAIFRPPFDLRTDIDSETANVLNAAASEALLEAREVYITAAGVMNARSRAAGLLFQRPGDLASAAQAHILRVVGGQNMVMASLSAAEELYLNAKPTPQTNVEGSLFNFDTGEWNDT